MEMKDKRLVEKLDDVNLDNYLKDISKTIPDASDKYDTIEIEHEPIQLLDKIRTKKIEPAAPEDIPEQPEEDDS